MDQSIQIFCCGFLTPVCECASVSVLSFMSLNQLKVKNVHIDCTDYIVYTCASISFQLSSRPIGIDGSHFDIIRSVWIQVLQDHIVSVSWYCSL